MATTTTNFGWDIPQSTDLVKDGATAIAALGQDIDTALIDLKGGTTGQVLAKASNTDLDYSWVAQDDSNAIQNAIVDAKGDIIAATGADTPARLAVGTNGYVLTADSAEATGLKWAASASGPTFTGATVYNSAVQSIANNTYTALTFNTESFDTDAYHSTATNTSRFTIPTGKAGKYRLQISAIADANATGKRIMYFYKNGVAYLEGQCIPGSTIEPVLVAGFTESFAVADYIEAFYYQSSGSTQNVDTRVDYCRFTIDYLGA